VRESSFYYQLEVLLGWTRKPTLADQEQAYALYSELRTRITTVPLNDRDGDEASALESIYKIFDVIRKLIKSGGAESSLFADLTVDAVNAHIRPFTARWHVSKLSGIIANDDIRREFRTDLALLQENMRKFCGILRAMCIDFPEPDRHKHEKPTGDPEHRLYTAECDAIRQKRSVFGVNNLHDVTGLALSGGGIRSATFSLGVLQNFAKSGVIKDVDFLSVVSGGGYLGTLLSSAWTTDTPTRSIQELHRLPLLEQKVESAPSRFLRNRSKYLLSGGILGQLESIQLILAGLFWNLVVLSPAIILASLFVILVGTSYVFVSGSDDVASSTFLFGNFTHGMAWLTTFAFALALLVTVTTTLISRKILDVISRLLILITGAFAFTCFLGWTFSSLQQFGIPNGWIVGIVFSVPVLAFVVGSTSLLSNGIRTFLTKTFVVSVPVLLLSITFQLASWMHARLEQDNLGLFISLTILLPIVIGVALEQIGNANRVSLFHLYRSRLRSAYLVEFSPHKSPSVRERSGQLKLSELKTTNIGAPYLVVNTAVNVPSTESLELRDRYSDSFVLCSKFCGSSLTGYLATEEFEERDPDFDLSSAMAVSGAAVSSYLGTLSTFRKFRFWLSLFNVRLGYWAPNPQGPVSKRRFFKSPPLSVLTYELTGDFDESKPFINLSDGGHFENLGIYELIRRRCRYIFAIDGGRDPDYKCAELLKTVRLAEIDFNAKIRLPYLEEVQTKGGTTTRSHFTVGSIEYSDDTTGVLIYLKLSLTGNEPEYIFDYKSRQMEFPHQSTLDQFFDEEQFEAYRALGYHVAADVLRAGGIDEDTDNSFVKDVYFSTLISRLMR